VTRKARRVASLALAVSFFLGLAPAQAFEAG
jgi:hypothetical protein